jgi:hypothetical protein
MATVTQCPCAPAGPSRISGRSRTSPRCAHAFPFSTSSTGSAQATRYAAAERVWRRVGLSTSRRLSCGTGGEGQPAQQRRPAPARAMEGARGTPRLGARPSPPPPLTAPSAARALDPTHPTAMGTGMRPDTYMQARDALPISIAAALTTRHGQVAVASAPFINRVPDVVESVMQEIGTVSHRARCALQRSSPRCAWGPAQRFGRKYEVFGYHGHPEVSTVELYPVPARPA